MPASWDQIALVHLNLDANLPPTAGIEGVNASALPAERTYNHTHMGAKEIDPVYGQTMDEMNPRFVFRHNVPQTRTIRVLSDEKIQMTGDILDIHMNGFGLRTVKNIRRGANLVGWLECLVETGAPRLIPFSAQCAWAICDEAGIDYLDIPQLKILTLEAIVNLISQSAGPS